jgi:hypothetical protein
VGARLVGVAGGWGQGAGVRGRGSGISEYTIRNTQYAIRFTPAVIASAFVAAFLLRAGGLLYPQFLSSDLTFHMNNLARVLGGTWAFASKLPNGTEVPYPPAAYLVLAPLTAGVPDLALLLRGAVSLLDAATVFPLAYIAARLAGPRAAGSAAWAYALLPAAFVYFAAGNYTNLFAQATFATSLAPWVALLAPRREGRAWGATALLAAGLTLTFLGHYGMLIAAFGGVVAASVPPLLTGPALARRRAGWVLVALALAVALAFALYYVNWLPAMQAQVAQVLAGDGRRATFDLGGLLAGTLRRLGTEWGGILGLGGLVGLASLALAQPGGPRRRLVAAWIGGLLAVGAVFAALDQVVGDSIRYPLLLAPWIALGVGHFWGLLARRGAAGPLFVALLAGAATWQLLLLWLDRIFIRYH